MSQTPIELKGSNFTLSVIHVHDAQPEEIRRAIEEKVEQASGFLKDAPVVINVAGLSRDTHWEALSQAVLATGLHVIGVSGCRDTKLKQAIIRSGLPLLTEGKALKRSVYEAPTPAQTVVKTRLINTPVRSGQQIYARNSDLIATSNVSAGAELIADGNIHIYGMMRGRAVAGASGDGECQVFCIHFSPELVSIAGQYWLSDQIPAEFSGKAARLCLQEGTLTIHPLI
ncbi:septum formation inhibitor [Sodalis-like endosymbiont of Proechinophthirus fluctus]|uniref:septum site-determining protein MinC n=1 Tax=Sodalis-like endosymbiont of Proechinophthirus fluctus TaxID=1462730 RepID=UPI0007A8F85B|nr:septum site-determining protein MinC [Sodalis-like endosymbiont of Proechinophthirus fluctus]KYP97333.1 septum formation inhibitor [Sodalis-like endosymbiont of Proechinophthirus fluctus]